MENTGFSITEILQAFRMIASDRNLKVLRYKKINTNLSEILLSFNNKDIKKEILEFCKKNVILIKGKDVIDEFRKEYERFKDLNSVPAFVVYVENLGLISLGNNVGLTESYLNFYEGFFEQRKKPTEFEDFTNYINNLKKEGSNYFSF